VLTSTKAIVLKTHKYAEADLIITFLTLNKGILRALAKGSRKTKSRFGSSLEPFTHSKITVIGKEQNLPRIIQSDIIDSFYHIRENIHDFAHFSKMAEVLLSLTPEKTQSEVLFSFFLKMLRVANRSGNDKKSTLYIASQVLMLSLFGYAPHLSGCGKCGANSLVFYPDSGTVLCKKCSNLKPEYKSRPLRITQKVIKFYSHCSEWSLSKLIRLKPGGKTLSTLSNLIDEHLNHLLSKKLVTSDFISKI
jgi:DNA repair protein RecO (recombination protein O)